MWYPDGNDELRKVFYKKKNINYDDPFFEDIDYEDDFQKWNDKRKSGW